LRQPLESGRISVARVQAHVTYPARFQLIAAMNPCRCGYLDDAARACNKAPRCATEYQSKISGPLFDRFDMAVDVAEVKTLDMLNQDNGEASERVAGRVAAARELQKVRFSALGLPYRLNTELYGDTLHALVMPDDKGKKLLEQATEQLRLSMRGYTRVLRVARTIADLEQSETVNQQHVGEALSYRQMQFGRVAEEA
jgi:magnesium chelatase family protein